MSKEELGWSWNIVNVAPRCHSSGYSSSWCYEEAGRAWIFGVLDVAPVLESLSRWSHHLRLLLLLIRIEGTCNPERDRLSWYQSLAAGRWDIGTLSWQTLGKQGARGGSSATEYSTESTRAGWSTSDYFSRRTSRSRTAASGYPAAPVAPSRGPGQDEAHRVYLFEQGLRPDVFRLVRAQRLRTLDASIEQALWVERGEVSLQERTQAVGQSRDQKRPFPDDAGPSSGRHPPRPPRSRS
uniref:Uncharacterized protein n=1 Tax=Ananas comosus var. bracteatus TaxID=296719 RepID=A0A6V7NWM1_ANACO|nr:unnamed protein product [Ananas comosus var. bracteatus]